MNQENQVFTEKQPAQKKKIYQKWWFWVACVLVVIVISTAAAGNGSDESDINSSIGSSGTNGDVTDGNKDNVTLGQKNALSKAKLYLKTMAFSREGLIDQLIFEGFTEEQAVYGVDNCGADWNEQAYEKAKIYLKTMSFSRQGLIDQLLFEGFTEEQAEYGVNKVGLD